MVQLPPQAGDLPLPPAPQDPPVLEDVVRAMDYEKSVEVATATYAPRPTPEDVARAYIYKTQVIMAYLGGNAAPPWFLPVINAAINAALVERLTPMKVTLAKTRNMLMHSGLSCPFDIVPFPDGSMPNASPHNLPPLTSAAAITGLNSSQLDAYCNGYVGVGHGLVGAAGWTAIARAIGCTVTE